MLICAERRRTVKYAKPALTYDQQVALLQQRGMAGDAALMAERLAHVSYYRLSGYWYPFRNADDSFRSGTTFDTVWERYVFDRRLRLLVMDAVERIEIAVRAQLSYLHAHAHGPFGYATDPNSLPKCSADQRRVFVRRVQEEVGRSKEVFVEHFNTKYGNANFTHLDGHRSDDLRNSAHAVPRLLASHQEDNRAADLWCAGCRVGLLVALSQHGQKHLRASRAPVESSTGNAAEDTAGGPVSRVAYAGSRRWGPRVYSANDMRLLLAQDRSAERVAETLERVSLRILVGTAAINGIS